MGKGKADNGKIKINPDLPPNVKPYPQPCTSNSAGAMDITGETDNDTPKFPGMGKSIGGELSTEGKVVRRIPGIGVITSERPVHATATATSADSLDNDCAILEEYSSPSTTKNHRDVSITNSNPNSLSAKKRFFSTIISDSDSDDDLLLSVAKKLKKDKEGKFEKYGLFDCTSPGTGLKIHGFQSVSNRTSDPTNMDSSLAADRNKRAMELGSSSDDSDDDCIPLGSVIQPVARSDNNADIWVSDESRSPVIPHTVPGESIDLQRTGQDSSHNASSSNMVVENQAAISIESSEPLVSCPVCSTDAPASQINLHLDSCLS